MNIKILTHLMPWEIDYALLSFSQLKKSEKFISDEINIEFSSVLNLSSDIIDWEKSKFPKEYFISKYKDISKNFNKIKITTKIIDSDIFYGHFNFQKEAISSEVDYYITMCPDMYFGEQTLYYIIESIKNISNKNFIITTQITKRWDQSWDVLVNENFLNIPYNECFKTSCFDVDAINMYSSPELIPLPVFKYAGWFDCYTKEIWERLTPVWDEWSGYGSWDTYSMLTLSLLKQRGYDIQQYLLKGQVISEYWNGNESQQNWGIDTYKDKNSEGLCGYYKKYFYINKNKKGTLDYNKLQEYAIIQFNKIINNET
jgi:hypothetical protein